MGKMGMGWCRILSILALAAFLSISGCGGCLDSSSEANERSYTTAVEQPTQPSVSEAELAQVIQDAVQTGLVDKVDYTYAPAETVLWVSSSFYRLSFQDKENLCGIVYLYVSKNGQESGVSIVLKDTFSGKVLGEYRRRLSGFGLKMK